MVSNTMKTRKTPATPSLTCAEHPPPPPGHDNRLMLLGISTVAGNQLLDKVTQNALDVVYAAGLGEIGACVHIGGGGDVGHILGAMCVCMCVHVCGECVGGWGAG